MAKYEIVEAGSLNEWGSHFGGFAPQTSVMGRRVLEREVGTEYIGITLNSREPGDGADYWHSHSEIEELYVFLEGEGEMGLDDDVVPVRAGTAIRVGQGVIRTWRCTPDSPTALKWVCIRAGGGKLTELPKDSQRYPERPLPW